MAQMTFFRAFILFIHVYFETVRSQSTNLANEFVFVNISLSWTEANGFCQTNHSGFLASWSRSTTFKFLNDLGRSNLYNNTNNTRVWIGLTFEQFQMTHVLLYGLQFSDTSAVQFLPSGFKISTSPSPATPSSTTTTLHNGNMTYQYTALTSNFGKYCFDLDLNITNCSTALPFICSKNFDSNIVLEERHRPSDMVLRAIVIALTITSIVIMACVGRLSGDKTTGNINAHTNSTSSASKPEQLATEFLEPKLNTQRSLTEQELDLAEEKFPLQSNTTPKPDVPRQVTESEHSEFHSDIATDLPPPNREQSQRLLNGLDGHNSSDPEREKVLPIRAKTFNHLPNSHPERSTRHSHPGRSNSLVVETTVLNKRHSSPAAVSNTDASGSGYAQRDPSRIV